MADYGHDFVGYGTAAEPLDNDESLSQYAAQNQLKAQKVRDKQGRERFHGAFTGGFSAGFYNTVGSKDGWTPATFVSSRNKSDADDKQRGRKPEDFMDEEDLDQFGIAPRRVKTSDDYHKETTKHRAAWDPVVPGLSQTISNLIKPAHSSVAVRLLGLMGWKQGQGLGPRVKRKSKQQSGGSCRVIGPALPPGSSKSPMASDGESDEDLVQNVTFAPKDMNPVDFHIKDDLHGIGYQALKVDKNATSSEREEERLTFGGHSRGITGKAFGVGIEEDEDDADIYGTEKMSGYDRMLTDEPDNYHQYTRPGGNNKGKDKGRLFQSSGKIIDGFCLALKTDKPGEKYKVCEVPKGYRPKAAISGPSQLPKIYGKMDSTVRSLLIGEKPPVSSKVEVEKDNPLLPGKCNAINLNDSVSTKTGDDENKEVNDPLLPPNRSMEPLNKQNVEFKPFAKNPEKQARYEKYLTLVTSGQRDAYSKVAPLGFSRYEKEREKEEFERSGKFFKTLTGVMASRFTRSKATDEEDDNKVSVRVDEESASLLDDKKQAVEMKLFGKLTRESYEWHPHRLLCKRFNIPNPYPDSQLVGLPVVMKDKISAYNFLDIESLTKEPHEIKLSQNTDKYVENPGAPDKVNLSDVTSKSLDGQKAPMDLFKAVFQSSESENDSSDEEEIEAPVNRDIPTKINPSSDTSTRNDDVTSTAELKRLEERYSQNRGVASLYEAPNTTDHTKQVSDLDKKVLFVPKRDRLKPATSRRSRWDPENDNDVIVGTQISETQPAENETLQTLGEHGEAQKRQETGNDHVDKPVRDNQGDVEETNATESLLVEEHSSKGGNFEKSTDDMELTTPHTDNGKHLATDEEDLWMPALPPSLPTAPTVSEGDEVEANTSSHSLGLHKKSRHKEHKHKKKSKKTKSHKGEKHR